MKTKRLLAILLALLLLLSLPLTACSDEEPAPGTEPDSTPTPTPTPDTGDRPPAEEGEPNTDPDYDPSADPEHFLSVNGYPMGFSVRFQKDGADGFDTATNTLLNGSNSKSYAFTAGDFRDMYRILDNANLWQLSSNLTYSQLNGSSAPDGPGALYTLTVVTAERGSRTYLIDDAAIARLSTDPDVQNLTSVVTGLGSCAELYWERVTA
ncbi:MAG: hypothetical protein IKM08_09495 [Clostridia bacterium]|nr:hypothetical protein [Clostridia bacterium]